MKVAVYCRVSTDKEDQVNSLENQQKYFKSYIEEHDDWELVAIFADEGISGTSIKNRVQFNKMIFLANHREIDLIITKEVSRFSRNTVDTLTQTRKLKEIGVGVFFINDNINTLDNEGEFRLTIMASVAQEESRKTSERVKWGQKRRMEQGVVFGNNSILGYNLVDGKLSINESQAEIVKQIYYKYVEEQKGSSVIAKELNNKGIKPVYADLWSEESVLKILKNEKYVGDILHKKYITKDFLSHIKELNKDKDDKIYIENNHEAIIDRERWNKAQVILKSRQTPQKDKSKFSNKYWCSGKVFCGECGHKFLSSMTKSKEGYNHSWVCGNKRKNGKQHLNDNNEFVGCNNARIREDILILCINEAIDLLCDNAIETKKEILKEITSLKYINYNRRINILKRKVDVLKNKKSNAISALIDEKITREELNILKTELDQRLNILFKDIHELEIQESMQKQQKERFENILNTINNIFNHSIRSEQLYQSIIDKIVIFNRSVQIYFHAFPYIFDIHFRISRANWEYKFFITESKILEDS